MNNPVNTPRKTEGILLKSDKLPKGFKLSEALVKKQFSIDRMLFEVKSFQDNNHTVTLKFLGLFVPKPKKWWCTVHNRLATSTNRRTGQPECEGGGILMSCACVEYTKEDKPNDTSTPDSAG